MVYQIGFIGAGQMARALAKGVVESGRLAAENLCAFDPSSQALDSFAQEVAGARRGCSNREVVELCEAVIIAVKPQVVETVFAELRGVEGGKLFVSIAAGVSLATLSRGLNSQRVIRVMPNTPCLVGFGAAGFALGPGATSEDEQVVCELLESVGMAARVPERLLDVVTGLSGSGPAYVYMVIEALSDGAVGMGMPRDLALRLATQTVLGAAKMVQATSLHPAVLKDQVASPGGTTMAGIRTLEDRAMRSALMAAVEAATVRSMQLGEGGPK